MLYEVSGLPRELYRGGRIDQRYHQTVQRGRGTDKVFVEAPNALEAFTTVLAEQHHGVLTKLSGRIFYRDLLGVTEDPKNIPRAEKEAILVKKGYVKPAPTGLRPDYVYQGRGGDTATISSQGIAASRGETYQALRPVRPIGPDTAQISPEALRAARALSDETVSPEELARRARIVEATSDYIRGQRAKGIFTPEQEAAAKAEKIKAAMGRKEFQRAKPKRDLYPVDGPKTEVPKAEPKPVKPTRPVQGTLFDMTPESYLGERLDASG